MSFSISGMNRSRLVGLYIACVFVGGALLAPWLYWLAQAAAPAFPRIAAYPFRRFVDRAVLIVALLGLWPVLRSLKIFSVREAAGKPTAKEWKLLGTGFLLGLLTLGLVAALVMIDGEHQLKTPLPLLDLVGKLPRIAFTAIAVALLEEVLFRGVLFGTLRKDMNWVAALILSSSFYALVHFMDPRATLDHAVTWSSGLEQLGRMMRGLTNLQAVVPTFLNLTLAGMLLGLAYERTGRLYCSVGLHAGWVFWLKSYGVVARTAPGSALPEWSTSRLADGWPALLVLAATLVVFCQKFWPARAEKEFPRGSMGAV